MVTLVERIGAAKVQNEHSPKCKWEEKLARYLSDMAGNFISICNFTCFEMNFKNNNLTFGDVTDVNNPSERHINHLLKKNCNTLQ